jgi:hypothetical protein
MSVRLRSLNLNDPGLERVWEQSFLGNPRTEEGMHKWLQTAAQWQLNFNLLQVVDPLTILEHKANIIDLLVDRGAVISPQGSFVFLQRLFNDKTPTDVLDACKRHWQHLIAKGLDVNGKYNRDSGNIFTQNISEPNVIRKALDLGADPFLRDADLQLNPLEHMQRVLEKVRPYDTRSRQRIMESMEIVKASQKAYSLNRMLMRAPFMQKLPPDYRLDLVRRSTGVQLRHRM